MSITTNIAREMSITDFNDLYTFSMPLEFDIIKAINKKTLEH